MQHKMNERIVCILISSKKVFNNDFKKTIKQKFSKLIKIHSIDLLSDLILMLYGEIKPHAQDHFYVLLQKNVDDILSFSNFFKTYVIILENKDPQPCINEKNLKNKQLCHINKAKIKTELLDIFFFLYYKNLLNETSYLNLFNEDSLIQKYQHFMTLKEKIIQAIDNWRKSIELYVQPIFDLRSLDLDLHSIEPSSLNDNKQIIRYNHLHGYELLSRIIDNETGNLIYPADFLEILYREPELSIAFQEKILKKLLEYFPYNPSYRIHINFTVDFIKENYLYFLYLKKKRNAQNFLDIEIVEYSENLNSFLLLKNDHFTILENLRKYGYKILLDDIIEGITNLSFLFDFQADGLKLSKNILSCLRTIEKDYSQNNGRANNAKINDEQKYLLLSFCDGLRRFKEKKLISLFAEGIEYFNDLLIAKQILGADYIQGFLCGKPQKLENVIYSL